MDSRSHGATTQTDVKQYYDSVNIPRILNEPQTRQGPVALLRALLRAQLLTIAHVHHSDEAIMISGRSRGTFTRTRGAVALGRAPGEAALAATEKQRVRVSWRLDDQHPFGVASYVDNLVAVGESPAQVCFQLEVIVSELRTRLGLDIKPSNREIILPAGSSCSMDESRWTRRFHMVSSAPQCQTMLAGVSRGACAARSCRYLVGANTGSRSAKRVSLTARIRLFVFYVRSVFDTFCILWPYSRSL